MELTCSVVQQCQNGHLESLLRKRWDKNVVNKHILQGRRTSQLLVPVHCLEALQLSWLYSDLCQLKCSHRTVERHRTIGLEDGEYREGHSLFQSLCPPLGHDLPTILSSPAQFPLIPTFLYSPPCPAYCHGSPCSCLWNKDTAPTVHKPTCQHISPTSFINMLDSKFATAISQSLCE